MTDPGQRLLRWIRRGVVFVIGGTVTLFGIVLFVTPGPALIVVPIGLMILATEFAWAKVLLAYVKQRMAQARDWATRKPGPGSDPGAPPDQA